MLIVADTSALVALAACDALGLLDSLPSDRPLLDDWRARKVARMNSIAVVGSLGVLVGAKAHGHIPAVAPYLAQIEAAGIYLSRELTAETLRLAGEE
jgi:predicted nucleic acid-binding protein